MPEALQLNNIKPARGSTRPSRRVGRGNAAGQGTTAGRGCKGQKSRAGGFHKVNFEGGQMPINRRLPKIGFRSRRKTLSAEIRLNALERLAIDIVDIEALKKAGLLPNKVRYVKLIASGEITRAVSLRGIRVTANARKAIEAAGGKVE